jgi:hypothetical protein
MTHRRLAKRKLGNSIKVGYSEIPSGYDVHADENIPTAKVALCYGDAAITHVVGRQYVHQVGFSQGRTLNVLNSGYPGRRQSAGIDDGLRDYRVCRSGIPDGIKRDYFGSGVTTTGIPCRRD